MNKINDLVQKDSKSFWKSINSLRHSKNRSVNLILATKWVEHYKFLLTDPSSFNFSLSSDVEETKDDLCSLDYTFNCKEVKKGISKLKSGKSNGPDLILYEFIKNSVANMVLVIVKLLNKILQLAKFPKQWNISHISSIFKSGDPND
jgi:hypothetical protein